MVFSFKRRFLCICFVGGILPATAQELRDSSFVKKYERSNVAEWNIGNYSAKFDFRGFGRRPSSFMLAANTNAYTGLYLDYKWVSVQYSWGIPGTELDRNVRLKHTSFSFRYNRPSMSFIPYYNYYNGLLLQRRKEHKEYDAFRDMRYYDAGLKFMYFTNTKKYSYKAGTSFAERQLKSAGGFIFAATPQWQRINWVNPSNALLKESLTYKLLSSDPQWVSVTLGTGYNYNFSIQDGRWIISPAATATAGGLKEVNSNNPLKPVFELQAWVNAGYSGRIFYGYLNAYIQYEQTNLIVKKLNALGNGLSVTVGYRFHSLPKKILGIL